ncbi:MAG: BamA/OMP85 family outer membrane protein [Gemmatimonadota bacterium]
MRRASRPAGTVCLLLAGLALASPVSGLAGQSADREVVGLEFEGNTTFTDDELARAVTTTTTRCKSLVLQPFCLITNWGFAHDRSYLDEADLPADALRLRIFYRRRGFREVEVDTAVERADGDARVEFRIEEGEPTRVGELRVTGLEGEAAPEAVRRRFPLQPGDRLDLVELERGKSRIVERLQNRGYPDAAVFTEYFVPAGETTAELTLDVQPGTRMRVGEVRVEGAEGLGTEMVRRGLTFEPGDWYSRSAILESQRELYQLGTLRFANIDTDSGARSDTLVDVVVSVTPARERTVRAGTGVTTAECARTEARVIHRNFPSGARRLRLTGRLSNLFAQDLGGSFPCTAVGEDEVFRELTYSLQADYRIPHFLSSRSDLQAALFLEREAVPDIFVRNSRGGELSLTHRLRPRMPLVVGWRPELTGFDERSADVFFCVNFGFCQPEDISVLTRARWLSPMSVGWRYDRTNAAFSPTSGYYVDVSLEAADGLTGSEYEYLRFDVNAADFERLGGDLVLATRFRAGLVESLGDQPFEDLGSRESVIHPRKRFFAGGAQSVRGVGQNLLGPTVLVMEAADCPDAPPGGDVPRETLVECARDVAGGDADPADVFDERPVGGDAAFEANLEFRVQVGGNWTMVSFVDVGQVWVDVGDLEPPEVTPGIGVRFASPVGPLRLDVGYDPRGARRVPVVSELPNGEILELEESVTFDPFTYDDAGSTTAFLRRLHFHLSIGEAF